MIFEGGRDLDLLPITGAVIPPRDRRSRRWPAALLTTIGKWLLAAGVMAVLVGLLFVTGD